MAELIVFKPKAEIDAEANVSAFIELCRRQLTVFGADLDFESDEWDVTKAVAWRARGKGRQRARFTNLKELLNKSPIRSRIPEHMASEL